MINESNYIEHSECWGRKVSRQKKWRAAGTLVGWVSICTETQMNWGSHPGRCLVWEGTVSGNDLHWKCVCFECLRRSQSLFGWSRVRNVVRMGTGTRRSWGLEHEGFVALSEVMGTNCAFWTEEWRDVTYILKESSWLLWKGQGRSKETARSYWGSPPGRQWWVGAAGVFPNPQVQAGV